jgi:hypothetical protein
MIVINSDKRIRRSTLKSLGPSASQQTPRNLSGLQSLNFPDASFAINTDRSGESDPIVHAIGTTFPKFNSGWHYAVTAPVVRPWDIGVLKLI